MRPPVGLPGGDKLFPNRTSSFNSPASGLAHIRDGVKDHQRTLQIDLHNLIFETRL